MRSFYRKTLSTLSALAFAMLVVTAIAQPAFGQCGELIYNGDFELGNTGFNTDYISSPGDLYPVQRYAVTDNPNLSHYCFGGGDHTSGTGNQMAINGAVVARSVVWSQQVNVLPNTNYRFSTWVTSHCYAINQAFLEFRIGGVAIAGYFAPPVAFDWTQFSTVWNSGSNTSVLVEIIDRNLEASGNDFGIDDISMIKIDETGPAITCNSGLTMWPPNHEYHTFTLNDIASVSDDCDANPTVQILRVFSDEEIDATGDGDGETIDDIVIAPDCQSVMLRAERQGAGNGRVYSIVVIARDNSGNTTRQRCTVSVPHASNGSAVMDPPVYAVQGGCGLNKAGTSILAPLALELEQNYPNPFNPSTEIKYALGTDSYVRLAVYDQTGREVALLDEGNKVAGSYTVSFDAGSLPSGVYMYRLDTPQGSRTMKMMLAK